MKLVEYIMKEDRLNIQSSVNVGARLGWIFNDLVIDVGFAQQWLIHFRKMPFSWVLPNQFSRWFEQERQGLTRLFQLYEAIKTENLATLSIQGEPVAVPVCEVHLLAPLSEVSNFLYPADWLAEYSSLHPETILGTNYAVSNCTAFYPGIAFIVGIGEAKQQLLGCSLINYWCNQGRANPALGPFLVTVEELDMDQKLTMNIFHNERLVDKQQIDVWESFLEEIAQYPKSVQLEQGTVISSSFHQLPFAVQLGDEVCIEMEHLGQLKNKVDKG